jgi:putative ABC transport system ATP-binding protein
MSFDGGFKNDAGVMVRAAGLCKRYGTAGREVEVLRDLDLTLERGKSTALHGVSGTGKTTLLNILGGIETPDAGTLEIDGTTLGADPAELTRHRQQYVGFVFQFYNLLPSLTVHENVLTGLEAAGRLSADAKARSTEALEHVGLRDRGDAFPAELSGGQQQRVAIARALAKDAPLVLADEPTGNLDPHTGEQVLDVLLDQCRAAGSTLVIVTHNPAIAERTDRSVRLVDGRLCEGAAV